MPIQTQHSVFLAESTFNHLRVHTENHACIGSMIPIFFFFFNQLRIAKYNLAIVRKKVRNAGYQFAIGKKFKSQNSDFITHNGEFA